MPNWVVTISKGQNILTGCDDDKTFQFWADDKQDAEDYVIENWRSISGADPSYFMVSLNELRTHGGHRPGAGRPKSECSSKPKTKAVRLPVELADKKDEFIALVQLISDWRERSEASSQTSVRWEKLRQLLKDVEALGF